MNECSDAPLPLVVHDPGLAPYRQCIARRHQRIHDTATRLAGNDTLRNWAGSYFYYGLHRAPDGWVFREWAPHATAITLVGMFSDWEERDAFALRRLNAHGDWELCIPSEVISHGDPYRLRMHWEGGSGDRIPTHARRVIQDPVTSIFSAQVWQPPEPYVPRHPAPPRPDPLLIYEAHVGMAQEWGRVGTYTEFREHTLPRIAAAGYTAIQLMGIMEHPYYGSFGYHVSNYFAATSRFGTPEELKELVDAIHGAGLIAIMDVVHSHAVRNEVEGLSRFDGSDYQFFHSGDRGRHDAWDSRCFDYGKVDVLHFLLSNCRFWIEEYGFDGFRFDGVTSMLYRHHGLGTAFDHYDRYFDDAFDEDAWVYLGLANRLIHDIHPQAVTVAEDVSGMPGLAVPLDQGGCGFDERLAMGVPDLWERFLSEFPDENWNLGTMWHELTNRRADEQVISYAESHDQALVGSKTISFWLMDASMYEHMCVDDPHPKVDRGMALHKMIRLVTAATADHGYLNFMGNEFGHPEWIDFPREGNNWSYHYARRQWSLRDETHLKYRFLADFDQAMTGLLHREHIIGHTAPRMLDLHEDRKLLVFERNGCYFFFNFHPTASYPDYRLEVLPGTYATALDSDSAAFGGHARRPDGLAYHTVEMTEDNTLKHCLELYLPCRTVLVLTKGAPPPRGA